MTFTRALPGLCHHESGSSRHQRGGFQSMAIRFTRRSIPTIVTFTTNTINTSSSPAVGAPTSGGVRRMRVEHHRLCQRPKLLYSFVSGHGTVVWSAPQPGYTFLVTSNENRGGEFCERAGDLATDDTIARRTVSAGQAAATAVSLQPMGVDEDSADANRNGFFLDLSTDNLPLWRPESTPAASRGASTRT